MRALLALSTALALGCAGGTPYDPARPAAASPRPSSLAQSSPSVQPWPEAGARFRSEASWRGADSAYSVELSKDRVLWLFGDTFVDPARDGSRVNGPNVFLRNSVALQIPSQPAEPDTTQRDLSRSTFQFFTGPERAQTPTSFFSETEEGDWFWPLHGIVLPDGQLLLFRIQVAKVSTGFGFAVRGWDAVAIDSPQAPPNTWAPRVVTRQLDAPYLIGSSVLAHGQHLYTFAAKNDDADHTLYLARFSLDALRGLPAEALSDPEWYTAAGYQRQSAGATPAALLAEGQIEISVHYEPKLERFIQIQTRGLFASDPRTAVVYRTATALEGPWSPMIELWKPPVPEGADPNKLLVYAAKAHPEQTGDRTVVTYVQNDVAHPTPIDAVYYPEVIRVGF